MANYNQAPVLKFNGKKPEGQFYQIPQAVADVVFNTFARQPAPLRLILVLIGTQPGFGLSEEWVLQRTGMTHSTYNKTRDMLDAMGWITHDPQSRSIIVNFDKILDVSSEYPNNSSIESIPLEENRSIESTPQFVKPKDKVKREQLAQIVGKIEWLEENVVKLPNGKIFEVI